MTPMPMSIGTAATRTQTSSRCARWRGLRCRPSTKNGSSPRKRGIISASVSQRPPARLTITDSGRKSQWLLRIGVTRRHISSTMRYHIVQCGSIHNGPVTFSSTTIRR